MFEVDTVLRLSKSPYGVFIETANGFLVMTQHLDLWLGTVLMGKEGHWLVRERLRWNRGANRGVEGFREDMGIPGCWKTVAFVAEVGVEDVLSLIHI